MVRAALDTLDAAEDPALVQQDLLRSSLGRAVELSDAERASVAAAFFHRVAGGGRRACPLAAQALAAAAPGGSGSGGDAEDPRVADLAFLAEAPRARAACAGGRRPGPAAARRAGRPSGVGTASEALARGLQALLDLDAPTVALPDAEAVQALSLVVNACRCSTAGQPAVRNQLLSLGFALGLVALVLAWRFRSVRSGLLATLPMGLALLVVYGGMGALGIHLDIGTSMLASIVIGAGVDYAVHLLSAWYGVADEPLHRAAGRAAAQGPPSGPALMVAGLLRLDPRDAVRSATSAA